MIQRDSERREVIRSGFIPLRRVVPNLLTSAALCCGLASLHFSLQADWDRALSAIAVAAVFDVLDGGAARLLRVSSRFGAVLDSLGDFLSFGVAPALILHQWMLKEAGWVGLAATMTYALCAALRLARYTATAAPPAGSPASRFFVGLPTPGAAAIVLIPTMLAVSRNVQWRLPEWLVIAHAFFVAWLMISRQPCFALRKIRIRRGLVVPLMLAAGLVVVSAAKDPWLTAATLATVYLLSVPVSVAMHHRLSRVGETGAPPQADEPIRSGSEG